MAAPTPAGQGPEYSGLYAGVQLQQSLPLDRKAFFLATLPDPCEQPRQQRRPRLDVLGGPPGESHQGSPGAGGDPSLQERKHRAPDHVPCERLLVGRVLAPRQSDAVGVGLQLETGEGEHRSPQKRRPSLRDPRQRRGVSVTDGPEEDGFGLVVRVVAGERELGVHVRPYLFQESIAERPGLCFVPGRPLEASGVQRNVPGPAEASDPVGIGRTVGPHGVVEVRRRQWRRVAWRGEAEQV